MKHNKFIFKFKPDYSEYKCRVIEDVGFAYINFIVMDNGIVVSINEDDSVELFSNNYDAESIKVIKDPDINGNMILYKDGTTVFFADGKKIYKIAMKK